MTDLETKRKGFWGHLPRDPRARHLDSEDAKMRLFPGGEEYIAFLPDDGHLISRDEFIVIEADDAVDVVEAR